MSDRPKKSAPAPVADQVLVSAKDIDTLKTAVISLGSRVTKLSHSLDAVNSLQQDQIPREEHEERWREEQEELIALRLQIRRRTYLVGSAFFAASLLALGITTGLVVHQQQIAAKDSKNACLTRVHNSKQAVQAYDRLLKSDTIRHDAALSAFTRLGKESALHGAQVKC